MRWLPSINPGSPRCSPATLNEHGGEGALPAGAPTGGGDRLGPAAQEWGVNSGVREDGKRAERIVNVIALQRDRNFIAIICI